MKRRSCLIPFLVLVCLCTTKGEFPLTAVVSEKENPAIFEDTVVWQDKRSGGWDIYGYDLATETEFVICDDPGDQTEPDIFENLVVWRDHQSDSGDIWGYDFALKKKVSIMVWAQIQEQPAVGKYNNHLYVVWTDSRNIVTGTQGKDIYEYNYTTNIPSFVSKGDRDQQAPDISGKYVAWQDYRNWTTTGHDIYGFDRSTQQTFFISKAANQQLRPALHGDLVVWYDLRNGTDYDIYGYNLKTSQEIEICKKAGNQKNPDVYGDLAVWQDDRSGAEEIFVYNLVTKEETRIVSPSASRDLPAVGPDFVVWQDHRSGVDDLYAFEPKPAAEHEFAMEIEPGVVTGSTEGAFGMDVTASGYKDDRDEWYLFVPSISADYIIRLCGSEFDTTLAVYDEKFVEVAFNDDFCGLQSQVLLKANAMQPYYIRVAGYDRQRGDYILDVLKVSLGGGALTKLQDSSYVQGISQYGFLVYPESMVNYTEPEAVLSGEIEYAVYDTVEYPDEFADCNMPGDERYIYAYQIFNGSENFLGLPQMELGAFLLSGPTPIDLNIGFMEDPSVYVLPGGELLGPGTAPAAAGKDWGAGWWVFENAIEPGNWSQLLLLRSDFEYEMCTYFRVNSHRKYGGAGIPVPADWSRNPADFAEDGNVQMEDFSCWAADYLMETAGAPRRTDFDGDGRTGIEDLAEFADRWLWNRSP